MKRVFEIGKDVKARKAKAREKHGGQTYTFDKDSVFNVFVISFRNFLSFFCFNWILRLA